MANEAPRGRAFGVQNEATSFEPFTAGEVRTTG